MDDVHLDPEQFLGWTEQVRDAWPGGVLGRQLSVLGTTLAGVESMLAAVAATTSGLLSHDAGVLEASAELGAAQLAIAGAAEEHQRATADLAADALQLAEEIHQTDIDASAVFVPLGGGP